MTTYRWYVLETTVPGDKSAPFAVTSWSRTLEAAQAKVEIADPKRDGLAFQVCAASRQQAMQDAVEVFGVKVQGYISREDKLAGRAIVKAAVMRAIFCPYTGVVMDMRRAVVVDAGTRSFVMSSSWWDAQRTTVEAGAREVSRAITVYDGRELFK